MVFLEYLQMKNIWLIINQKKKKKEKEKQSDGMRIELNKFSF